MPSVKLSVYGLFLATGLTLLVAITLLILQIVFNYVGFITNDFALISCTDPYLFVKYLHLQHQIEVAFVGTCTAIAALISVLVITGLSAKNLYQLTKNRQQQIHQQFLSPQILSRTKFAIIYVLTSLGTLGNIVCFGMYLAFWIESKKDTSACSFTYNQTYLLVLVILSGIWLAGFITIYVFLLMGRQKLIEYQQSQIKENKYKEMINVTEQPGMITKKDPYRNYNQHPQYTQQHFDGDAESFRNRKFNRPNQNQSILNSQNSFGGNNSKKEKQTFQQYRARQMKELMQKKNPSHQNSNYLHLQDINQHPYQHQQGPKSNDVLKFYQKDNENSKIKEFDKNFKEPNQIQPNNNNKYNSSRFISEPKNDNQPVNYIGKEKSNYQKPYSPIRNLAQNANEHPKYYEQDIKGKYQNSPQIKHVNKLNPNSYYPEQSNRGSQQDTRGQLVFYKKSMQKNRGEDFNVEHQPFKNKPNYSSGEVSFKSPSRFESKFAEEQNDYLRRNAQNSILPSHSIKQVAGGSRKIIFDDKYSSSGVPASNLRQSRNLDSSPGQSRSKTKGREGVLTSYIRGKFS